MNPNPINVPARLYYVEVYVYSFAGFDGNVKLDVWAYDAADVKEQVIVHFTGTMISFRHIAPKEASEFEQEERKIKRL